MVLNKYVNYVLLALSILGLLFMIFAEIVGIAVSLNWIFNRGILWTL